MRLALAKLEATLRLITKHHVDHLQVKISLDHPSEFFDFNTELQNLINGAREAIRKYEDMVREGPKPGPYFWESTSEEKRP
jgi:hypothetical protein